LLAELALIRIAQTVPIATGIVELRETKERIADLERALGATPTRWRSWGTLAGLDVSGRTGKPALRVEVGSGG
jgi:hypothetical protein